MLDLEKSSVISSPNNYYSIGQKLPIHSPSSLSLPAVAHLQTFNDVSPLAMASKVSVPPGSGVSPALGSASSSGPGYSSGLGLGQFFNTDKKSAKRTAGRLIKLHSDIYALAGRLDLAISKYLFLEF